MISVFITKFVLVDTIKIIRALYTVHRFKNLSKIFRTEIGTTGKNENLLLQK